MHINQLRPKAALGLLAPLGIALVSSSIAQAATTATAPPAGLTSPSDPADVISAIEPDEAPLQSIQTAPKPAQTTRDFARFGFSLGMGVLEATGNRGALWEPSHPLYDLAAYYWLTPQVAVSAEGFTVDDSYSTSSENGGIVTVNVKHIEAGIRYYGDLHSLLPRIVPGFISPFASVGFGAFSMSKSALAQQTTEPNDTELGMTLGAGLRLEFIPRSMSLELLGRWNSVNFKDTYDQAFQSSNRLPDLTGQLLTWNANVLVTF